MQLNTLACTHQLTDGLFEKDKLLITAVQSICAVSAPSPLRPGAP